MSWPNGTFPPAEAPDFSNIFGMPLPHVQEITEQHINFETTINQDNELVHNPEVGSSSAHAKKRKLKSKVWDDFRKYEDEDGKEWAECNHCKKKFGGSSKSGTTHLNNHLQRCPTKRLNTGGSGAADKSANKTGDSLTTTTSAIIIKGNSKIDEELNQLDKTRMMIKNWVPLEYIKEVLLNVFKEEKQKLMRLFHELPCCFNVSIEYLHNNGDKFYASVHFIDNNWELKKKVIYFNIEDEHEDGDLYFYEKLKFMLKDWNIEKDICSMVDHFYLCNLKVYGEMKKWVSERGSLPLAGTFLPLPWLVDLLRDMFWWGSQSDRIIDKMRKLKEYVSSNGNNSKFEKAVDKAATAKYSKLISQPFLYPTNLRGFELVEWGVGLKEVFWELEQMDDAFKPINLTKDKWDEATAIYEMGKLLKDLSDCKCTTPNVYFPKICHLYKMLLRWPKSDMGSVWEDGSEVRKYYLDEFWSNLNLILAITVILDPRFKMDIVGHCYMEIYGNDSNIHIKKIIDEVNNIYLEYARATVSTITSPMLCSMRRPCTSLYPVDYSASSTQSELDRYLKDSKFPAVEDFDILEWWSSNSPIYPTLARMARDYLAIPIGVENRLDSSLVNEILNIIHSEGLDDDIKRALVHTKAWF